MKGPRPRVRDYGNGPEWLEKRSVLMYPSQWEWLRANGGPQRVRDLLDSAMSQNPTNPPNGTQPAPQGQAD